MEVADSWLYESTLGSGGFGIVELWKNTHTGEQIAIKKCKSSEDKLDSTQKNRWKDEVQIMSKLQHPNIVVTKPVPYEFQTKSSLPVLCMEYCRKGNLRHVLNQCENCCGLSEQVATQVMIDITEAVEYLHSHKISHRDLKPENVVIQQSEDRVIYKLIDLGYAKALGHDSVYASIVGTLNYVAPELLWTKKYSCTVDYWSLGILFYEIITGSRPFLPDEKNLIRWRQNVEKKSYEDISAKNIDGNIVFQKNIEDPTDLSLCIRDALVEWFRIVLQWDPKKRGKQCQVNNENEIVVFKMLRQILSKKIVRIFCVPMYKIYDYEVNESTSLRNLQFLIERDTKIPISSQELFNSSGALLNDDITLQDTFLTLFRKENICNESYEPNLPDLVKKMIERSKMKMSKYELKQCYSTAMFFIKKEQELFKFYILALSMKIDLIISRIDALLSKNREMVSENELLKTEFNRMKNLMEGHVNDRLVSWQNDVQIMELKLENLSTVINNLEVKCKHFSQICKILTEFGHIDWMTKYQTFLNEGQAIFEDSQNCSSSSSHQPTRMAKLIVKFLNFQQTKLSDPKLTKMKSEIERVSAAEITEDLLKSKKFSDSADKLIKLYREEISNISKKWMNYGQAASSHINVENMEVESDDNVHLSASLTRNTKETTCDEVIYDNLVLRYMMHDVMAEIHQNFLQITNLNP